MRALTLGQPWANLLAAGIKTSEVRRRAVLRDLRDAAFALMPECIARTPQDVAHDVQPSTESIPTRGGPMSELEHFHLQPMIDPQQHKEDER